MIKLSKLSNDSLSFSLNEHESILSINNNKREAQFSFKFPFHVSKIPSDYRDVNSDLEDVLIFKNKYYSQFDICELYKRSGDGRKLIGYLYNPTILQEKDAEYLYKKDVYIQTAIFRSIVQLLKDYKEISFVPDNVDDLQFNDFYPQDIIVGVFPKEWNEDFNENRKLELFFNLYSYGFYNLQRTENFNYQPPSIGYQQSQFESLIKSKNSRKIIVLDEVSDVVLGKKYFHYYFKEIIMAEYDMISKFHQIYGFIEVFKEEILKRELLEKICGSRELSSLTGHKILKYVNEIATDSSSVQKLFNKYSGISKSLIDLTFWDILKFIELSRDSEEIDKLKDFPQTFYFLRNIIVHDIQFLFDGDKEKSDKVQNNFARIVHNIEYTIINAIQLARI
ncbi:MAG: hypothetical protein WC756_07170 [Taibaiella sp.]|jgi:hypothetical protein